MTSRSRLASTTAAGVGLFSALGVAAVTLAMTVGSRVAQAAEPAPRAVRGLVLSTAGEALQGARVELVDPTGAVLAAATTNFAGGFRLEVPAIAKGKLVVRVTLEGLPPVETPLGTTSSTLRIVLGPAEGDLDLEVKGSRDGPTEVTDKAAEPTRYAVDAELLQKMAGTRGDPFAAATSLPSAGRPPALSTLYIVRGAGPESSATFLDGAPLPHAFHFGGVVAILPPAFVESIAIVPGGFGVEYGRATAGIIDVKLASPRSDGAHGSLQLDAIDAGAWASTPIGSTTRVAVGARRSHVDAWIGSLLGDRVAGDLPRYLDGQIVVEQDLGAKARARVGLVAGDDAVSVTDPNQPADKPRSGSWSSSMVRAHARIDAQLGEEGTFLGVLAVGRSNDTILGEVDQWSDARRTLYGRVQASFAAAEGARLGFGADVQATRVDGRRVLSIPTSSFGGSATFAMRGGIVVERVEPGAFAQLALRPVRALTMTAGLRLDRAPLGEVVLQPRLAIRLAPNRDTALKGYAGLYARPNPMDAVDARDFEGTLLPVAVRSGPVRGAQAGAGIEHSVSSALEVRLDAWTRAESNVLVAAQQPARPIWADPLAPGAPPILEGYHYPLNAVTARTRALGIEAWLRLKVDGLTGFVGWAVGRAEIRDAPDAPWRRAPFDQTHVLNAAAVLLLGAGWEAGLRFRLAVGVLDSPYPAADIAPKSDPNVDPSRPLPELSPLHTLDLRLERTFVLGPTATFSAYAEVRNVYDRRAREPLAYNYVYGYPVVGQGLPILPNLGLRGAF